MSWLGSGEYLLFGNGLMRGRKWNEPFPSNIHILASVSVGDVSPCGTSGRYACGDSTIADLRSGDGWQFIEPLSIICYPARIADDSGIYDADPKGSPDGTKVCFVSNYPLKDGPVTRITEAVSSKANRIPVASTAGFPDSGHINVHREVIVYQSKTATSFEGITRRAFDTAGVNLRPGRTVTSFEARCLTDAQWQRVGRPAPGLQKSIGRSDSLLIRQSQTDVYAVVVRRPDRPHLRRVGDGVQVIPGENHNETAGYRLLCNGRSVTNQPIQPGATFHIDQPGRCTAVAVEWSGVESEPSVPLTVERPIDGHVLNETPEDFSWTSDRWNEDQTLREIVHLHDGVIRREWYSQGQLDRCHDLNNEGKAIRQTQYTKGQIAVREYFHRDGHRVSQEVFDSDGFITETIRYQTDDEGAERETDHWWFERGMPVREHRGQRDYVKRGDRFGRLSENGEFMDTPRAAVSD